MLEKLEVFFLLFLGGLLFWTLSCVYEMKKSVECLLIVFFDEFLTDANLFSKLRPCVFVCFNFIVRLVEKGKLRLCLQKVGLIFLSL